MRGSVMRYLAWSRRDLVTRPLPHDALVVQFCDPDNALTGLPLVIPVHDIGEPTEGLVHFTPAHARWILSMTREKPGVILFVCDAGVGRSVGAMCAMLRLDGRPDEARSWERTGAYNRLVRDEIMRVGGMEPPVEPLVSVVARVKYPFDRAHAFVYSMRRQRWRNWELVLVTDGDYSPSLADDLEAEDEHRRVRVVETEKHLGRWGHPHRQEGIDAARGEWVGLQNDDNYLTPGYVEQMVEAGEESGAQAVSCQYLGKYAGFGAVAPFSDVGGWFARRGILPRWEGAEFESDHAYLSKLLMLAGERVAVVNRPLWVKC